MDTRYALFRRTASGGDGRTRRHALRSIPYLALPLPCSNAHGAGSATHVACARRHRARSGPL